MPSSKENTLSRTRARIRSLFHRSPPSAQVEETATHPPGSSLHTTHEVAMVEQEHLPVSESESNGTGAPLRPHPVPGSTDASTAPLVRPTVDEARADAKKHSRAYDASIAAFSGITVLAKLVEPCLDGTPFKAPASVFLAIAQAIETAKSTQESADDSLDSLATRMQDIARYFADSKDEDSMSMLNDYAQKLVAYAQKIHAVSTPTGLRRLNVSGSESELKKIVDQIDMDTKNFHIRVLLAIEGDTKDIRGRVFRSDMRSWNRAPTALYKADAVGNQPKRQACAEGTRVEVLQRITQWAVNSSSPPIFWLSGMAGSGKSTIAYTLCQHFSERSKTGAVLGASFFCSRQVADLRRMGNIVPTLAYQLAHRFRSFANALDTVDPDVVNVSGEQVEKLLLEPWKSSTRERHDELPPFIVVIDALDEIEEEQGATLLNSLIEVTSALRQDRKRQLKIFVTSRPHPDIVTSSASLGRDAVYRLEDIGVDQGKMDVLTFLQAQLPDLAFEQSQLLNDLVERSGGLFIYAATITRLLASPRPSERLSKRQRQRVLSDFLGSSQTSTLSTLGAVYDLYNQVLDEAMPPHLRQHRLPILHRILCIQQPLSIQSLARLADVDSEEDVDEEATRVLIETLHAVLYISDLDDCVYIYHKSFSDFMCDVQTSGRELACDLHAQHLGISRASLRIMQASLRFNISNLPSSYLLDSQVPHLAERIQKNILDVPGLEYACRYWMSHVVQVPYSGHRTQRLCDQLSEFMDAKVLFWMEVSNLLGLTVHGTDGLRAVTKWAQHHASNRLKTVLAVVLRVARSFFWTAASTSTPHLYISCLPTESAMYRDLPSMWQRFFTKAPRVSSVGARSQGGVLTRINVNSSVLAVAFSPDGTLIASGAEDGLVCIWNSFTGAEVRKFVGHTKSVYCVAFSSDATRIVSGSSDRSVRIWDSSTGTQVHLLRGHSARVTYVGLSPDDARLVSGSWDGFVLIWDVLAGVEAHRFTGYADEISSVAISPNGEHIVSGFSSGFMCMWNTVTGVKVLEFDGGAHSVKRIAFSPDGTRFVSSCHDDSLRIWDAATGAEVKLISTLRDDICSITFSPDGMHIVFGCTNGYLSVWNVSTGDEVHTLDGHKKRVHSVMYSSDGTRIISGSSDHFALIWDVSGSADALKIESHTSEVDSVVFSPDGTLIASCSHGEDSRIWHASTGVQIYDCCDVGVFLCSLAFSPDGTRIASGSRDTFVRVWDMSTDTQVHVLKGHTDVVSSVAWSPDGKRIVSGSQDRSIYIWDALGGTEVLKIEGHVGSVDCVAYSPVGTCIASGSSDQFVRIWDALTGAEMWNLEGHAGQILCVAFSADGNHIASSSANGFIQIWDALNGELMREIISLNDDVGSTVSSSVDESAFIFLQGSRRQSMGPFALEGYLLAASTDEAWEDEDMASIHSLAFSPSNKHLISGSGDSSVRIWDVLTGAEVREFRGHTSEVRSVAFSPDGTRVVSGSYDKSVRVWNVSALEEQRADSWHLVPQTGWIESAASSNRLFWIPPHLHSGLYDGRVCTLVISPAGRTHIDFNRACVGTEWAQCYQP